MINLEDGKVFLTTDKLFVSADIINEINTSRLGRVFKGLKKRIAELKPKQPQTFEEPTNFSPEAGVLEGNSPEDGVGSTGEVTGGLSPLGEDAHDVYLEKLSKINQALRNKPSSDFDGMLENNKVYKFDGGYAKAVVGKEGKFKLDPVEEAEAPTDPEPLPDGVADLGDVAI